MVGNYINTSDYFVTNTSSSQYFTGSYAYQIKTIKFYGVETEFNWDVSDRLTLLGNYSFLKNGYSKETDLATDTCSSDSLPGARHRSLTAYLSICHQRESHILKD